MDEQILDRVSNWLKRDEDLCAPHTETKKDPFIHFFVCYQCFDALLTNASNGSADYEKKEWLKSGNNCFRAAFEAVKEEGQNDLKSLKELPPVHDMRPGHENTNITLADSFDFENVADFIYQIRCNLFHGSKNPSDGRDEKLVTHAGNFLEKWVRKIVLQQDTRGIEQGQ